MARCHVKPVFSAGVAHGARDSGERQAGVNNSDIKPGIDNGWATVSAGPRKDWLGREKEKPKLPEKKLRTDEWDHKKQYLRRSPLDVRMFLTDGGRIWGQSAVSR